LASTLFDATHKETDMLKTLFATTALALILAVPASAAVPADDATLVSKAPVPVQQLAHSGSGGNSGPGGGNSGPGGGSDDDSDNDDDDNDDDGSGSGRGKPRAPGGSGCDDPGDVEEHASCSPAAG
jgi:hypothetical protein